MNKIILILFISLSFLVAGEKFLSASYCGEYHNEIYKKWKLSMHENASTQKNSLFRGMYDWAIENTQGRLKQKCIICHSPMSNVFSSIDTTEIYNKEGITCQFCHSIKEIINTHSPKGMLTNLDTVYSFKPDTNNIVHNTAHREYFNNSEFCLPCHAEMKNPRQVSICQTGDEWKTYFEKYKKNCQDCHMFDIESSTSHLFAGTHRGNILKNSVDINLSYNKAEKDLLIVLTSTGVEHAIPTGTPLRMVILKVEGFDEKVSLIWQNWIKNPIEEDKSALFMKILSDNNGVGPLPPWKATQILYEKRLMPDNPVTISYRLNDSSLYDIEVNLYYHFAPASILQRFQITDPELTRPKLIAQKGILISE
jgi:hypothetical protein